MSPGVLFPRLLVGLSALALSACSLAPKHVTPVAPVPAGWPVGDAYLSRAEAALPEVSYSDVFRDPRLQQLIAQALVNNRDLQVAAANLSAARALVRVVRADQFPAVGLTGSGTFADNGGSGTIAGSPGVAASARRGWAYAAQAGVSSFELDFFGKYANATEAQRNDALATEAAARTVRLGLIADLAQAWAAYGADRDLLAIAQATVSNAERSVALTSARLRGGIAPRSDLRQAEQILETARGDVAEQTAALAQDVNAIRLLVGSSFDQSLLPASIAEAVSSLAPLPAGTSSQVLLRRPDVVQAEYQLRAANADIGVARAQLFPSITLTGLFGFASDALSSLFSGDHFRWSAGGNTSWQVFNAGGRRANVDVSEAQRNAALANYERAVQIAFREVSDALAQQGTLGERLRAADAGSNAAADTARLTEARYRFGVENFLSSLDAQRSLYAARRAQIAAQFAVASNRVTLYRVLGGDQATATAALPLPSSSD
ncbi:efflux transporter outer membrane subunit [Novosphingobium sp. M1R2S20]|uniref:Efflux transporter outer membrane subunit n=1 Tax=Novosphingobium rhizovicinum TaxID=3228928 RepID=A0ABV3R8B1_9SPHN